MGFQSKRWPSPFLSTRLSTLLSTSLLACLQGCVAPAPQLDARFGASTRANLAAQAIAPAAANPDPTAGIDGRAARAAYERYQRSFAEAEQPTATLVRDR